MSETRKKLYLFYGDDEYRVAEEAKALVEKLVAPEDRTFGLEIYDGRQETVGDVARVIQQAIEGLQTIGFFGSSKVIWLRDITFIAPRSKKEGAEDTGGRKEFVDKLRDFLPTIPDGQTLVLSGTKINSRYGSIVPEATKMAKAGTALVQEYKLPKYRVSEAAANLLYEEAKKRNHPLPQEICSAIVARAGTDSRQLINELEKLLLYAGDSIPTLDDVTSVISPTAKTESWDLLDAFGSKNLKAALPLLRRLLDAGANEIMLVIQLQYRVNDLLVIRDSIDRRFADEGLRWSDEQSGLVNALSERMAKSISNGFTSKRLLDQARRWTRLDLRNARHVLDQAHARLTSIAMAKELVLELALAEAMQKKS